MISGFRQSDVEMRVSLELERLTKNFLNVSEMGINLLKSQESFSPGDISALRQTILEQYNKFSERKISLIEAPLQRIQSTLEALGSSFTEDQAPDVRDLALHDVETQSASLEDHISAQKQFEVQMQNIIDPAYQGYTRELDELEKTIQKTQSVFQLEIASPNGPTCAAEARDRCEEETDALFYTPVEIGTAVTALGAALIVGPDSPGNYAKISGICLATIGFVVTAAGAVYQYMNQPSMLDLHEAAHKHHFSNHYTNARSMERDVSLLINGLQAIKNSPKDPSAQAFYNFLNNKAQEVIAQIDLAISNMDGFSAERSQATQLQEQLTKELVFATAEIDKVSSRTPANPVGPIVLI